MANCDVCCLPEHPDISNQLLEQIRGSYIELAETGLPEELETYIADHYRLDLTTEYAGLRIQNPWGKASGQLSMTSHQVSEDVRAGLGFVVLKTVIAQDAQGSQTMQAWASKESRMLVEPIFGQSGETGWTVSWKGRGWWQSFEAYLQLIRDAQQAAQTSRTLIIPSCKYHLPSIKEDIWNVSEYEYTTRCLLEAWKESANSSQSLIMPLEKDFSPTLAGSDRATAQRKILEWLRTVPRLMRSAVASEWKGRSQATVPESPQTEPQQQSPIRVGLKLFNALFDDEFQLQMLRTIHEPGPNRPDFFVYGNRLFDPNREFDGHRGIAYGGPDLSDRNLRIMTALQQAAARGEFDSPPLPWSATGNITSGKMALEYALRGASSFQLHTFFQLPADQYRMKAGSKTAKALHELYFHPQRGFIVWMHHLANRLQLPDGMIRFRDIIGKRPAVSGL